MVIAHIIIKAGVASCQLCRRGSTMATTELMYKGTCRKPDLVYMLRERGYTTRSIKKKRIKDAVQALIETDAGYTEDKDDGDDADDDDDDSEDEDSEDENSQDGGSEDESSHREDNEDAADNATALGFMKLLGVDIDTPEDGLGTLADSK